MSTAAAAAAADAPPRKSKKTLIIIVAAVLLVLVLGGVGAMLLMKKPPAESEGDDEAVEDKPVKTAVKHDPKAVPTYVPLDPFVVNLADRDADRYAQIGITLEIADTKLNDQIKVYMPAVRHAVLMVLADKTAAQLIDREGKVKLAREVQRETSRVLGAEIADEPAEDGEPSAGGKKDAKKGEKGGKKKKPKAPVELPIRAVHFSNFIIQ